MLRSRSLVLAALLLCVAPARAETPASDPRAVAIADQVMASLGGRKAWDALVGLRWTFASAVNDTVRPGRRHAWNKHTMWHRVDGTNRAGQKYTYIENLSDTTGMAWVNGTPIEGDSLKKLMRNAHALWINDAYWFLMSYKLRDDGVTLTYDGEVKDSTGTTFDKVGMSFDKVGLTPGDHYWVYVNRANHRIERWDHLLQGNQPPPTPWTLEGYEQHDGLWFSTVHKNANRALLTNAVETVKAFGPDEFKGP